MDTQESTNENNSFFREANDDRNACEEVHVKIISSVVFS